MFIHIQCWSVRSTWKQLSLATRITYFNHIKQIVQDLHLAGIHLINYPLEVRNIYFLHQHYLLIWRMPHRDDLAHLYETLQKGGWNHYFEEIALQDQMIMPHLHLQIGL